MSALNSFPVVIHGLEPRQLPEELHLAVGIFDGVHLGHQAVIQSAVRSAKGSGGLSGVLTFFPHPTRLFSPENPTRLLMPPRIKSAALKALGVDIVVWKKFTRQFATLEAGAFPALLKDAFPTLRALHIGENFRFGKGRLGDVQLLIEEGARIGLSIFSVERLRLNGQPISSSRIRSALVDGNIHEVNQLLGEPYCSESMVKPGMKLASQLGFPTLNLPWNPELMPRYGVYAVRVSGLGGILNRVPAVANYGVRPTVSSTTKPLLEVHLLTPPSCFPAELGVGARLKVDWLHFIRPEFKFSGLDALRQQITKDKADAEYFFRR